MGRFGFDQKISSLLAFILILLLSFIVAWNAISVGNTLIETAPHSKTLAPAGVYQK